MERADLVADAAGLARPDDRAERVEEADLPELAPLTQRALRGTVDDHGRDDQHRLRQLRDFWRGDQGAPIRSACLLIRDAEGRALSFALTSALWETAVVSYLMTEPVAQRSGYGSALLRAAADAVVREGHRELALRVTMANPAHDFYRRLGFEDRPFPPPPDGLR